MGKFKSSSIIKIFIVIVCLAFCGIIIGGELKYGKGSPYSYSDLIFPLIPIFILIISKLLKPNTIKKKVESIENMNRIQQIILLMGCLTILYLILYPNFYYENSPKIKIEYSGFTKRTFILYKPENNDETHYYLSYKSYKDQFEYFVFVVIGTIGLIRIFKNKEQ